MSRQPSGSRSDPLSSPGPDAPSDPDTPSPPSRSRRGLLALAGGGVFATAGCLSALGSSGEANASVGLTLDRLEFADGFGSEAASIAETYGEHGEHGVWGIADGPGVDGPTYVRAYRDALAVPGGADGEDGRTTPQPWVVGDAAAVVYRLDGDEDAENAYRVWLWTGARARQEDGRLGRASITRLSAGAAPAEGWALADHAPRSAFREGPVPVSLGERGPSGRTPLPGGGIAPENGENEGVAVAWQGIARGVRSVNAVCEFRPTGGEDRPFEARVSFGVAGGRGVL